MPIAMPRYRQHRSCSQTFGFGHCCVFYSFVFFIFVCSIIMLVTSVTKVKEYQEEITYTETTCQVKNIYHDVNYTVSCEYCVDSQDGNGDTVTTCGPSGYPCVEVWVEYMDKDSEYQVSALLHSDIRQLAGSSPWCSFSYCLGSFAEGEGQVLHKRLEYEELQQQNTSIPCFYKSKNSTHVVVEKLQRLGNIVHWYIWPIVIVIVSIAMIILLAVKYHSWAHGCCKKDQANEAPIALSQPIVSRRPQMATCSTQTATDTAVQTQPQPQPAVNPQYPQEYCLPSQPTDGYGPVPPPPPYSEFDPAIPIAPPAAPPSYEKCEKS